MRLKGHHNRRETQISRPFRDGLENGLMSEVKSVEIPDAQNAGTACESVRRFGQ